MIPVCHSLIHNFKILKTKDISEDFACLLEIIFHFFTNFNIANNNWSPLTI